TPSEIAGELYFVNDYYDQLSYVGYKSIQTLKKGNLDFYILFKSKKIPESIGFPRLLMNEKSYALQDLEGYSIARYSNNRLVMRFGSYNYPIFLTEFKDEVDHKGTFQTVNGTSHMIYRQAGGQG